MPYPDLSQVNYNLSPGRAKVQDSAAVGNSELAGALLMKWGMVDSIRSQDAS